MDEELQLLIGITIGTIIVIKSMFDFLKMEPPQSLAKQAQKRMLDYL